MSYRAAWLIGSYADLPEQEITVDGSPALTAEGSYYLYDAAAGLSLLAAIQNVLVAAGVAGAQAVLIQEGRVRLFAPGSFDLSWGTATPLRDLLGYTANLAGQASYYAPGVSPLLWMPGKPETPIIQRLGTVGHRTHNAFQSVAPYSGTTESVSHGYREYARYSFPMVDTARTVDASYSGGTFGRWFDQVAARAARWKLYREVVEDTSGLGSVMSYLDQPLGPYVVSAERKGPTWKFDTSKGFERTDRRAVVPEYPL